MGAFWHRLSSRARVGWTSSTAFATVGTAVTTLLVLPLLDIGFDVLMGSDLSAPSLVRTGYAAALVALTVSVSGGIVSAVAADRNLGIFQEVHTRRRVDVAYWIAVAAVPAALSVLTAVAAISGVFAVSRADDLQMLARVVMLAPVALACGLLLGVAAAGIGVDLPDPYLGSTIIGALLPVLAGAIVPMTICPAWLQALSYLAPMSGTLTAIDTVGVGPLVSRDLLVAMAWALVGLAATRHAVVRLRAGLRRDVV